MSPPPLLELQGLERVRDAVARRIGLQIDPSRLDLLAQLVAERMEARGWHSSDEYVRALQGAGAHEEIQALAERLTVGETYFFRNENDLRAFVRAVLPSRVAARRGERRLRILSAGCSSGEEPYTLAMLVRGVPELSAWDVAIRGIDLNPAALLRARTALYGPWALRQTPEGMKARFFQLSGREHRVIDGVRSLVTFEERNLAEPDPVFWSPGAFDVVFCRNVLMYFAPEETRAVVRRIAASLRPGGFLFLGHAETLRGTSTAFHLRHTDGTFYYQLRKEGGLGPDEPASALDLEVPPAAGTEAEPGRDWAEEIRGASERIAALARGGEGRGEAEPAATEAAQPAPEPAEPGAPSARPADPLRFSHALELLKKERFSEALGVLGPPDGAEDRDPDQLILRAVLLTSSGDFAEAEVVCGRILDMDELSAEAHYVKALLRERAGDLDGAADHDHYALYLDPSFAMPRVHLGLMARRAGQTEKACRELTRALALLAAEDASRVLLLGGGFTRDALADLCRAELRRCGGGG